jgi:hypothetical protein
MFFFAFISLNTKSRREREFDEFMDFTNYRRSRMRNYYNDDDYLDPYNTSSLRRGTDREGYLRVQSTIFFVILMAAMIFFAAQMTEKDTARAVPKSRVENIES